MNFGKLQYTLIVLGSVFLALTSGCTVTANDVRKVEPENKITFTAPANYLTVYRKVTEAARNCYRLPVLASTYTDTKTATIFSQASGNGVNAVMWVVDLSQIDEQQTKVSFYYPTARLSMFTDFAVALKKWALTDSQDCP